ncbi:iron/zinc/copper transport system substrate-binding protein [Amphibacillus marinus]|uniref:Iron/zinc/copper transport system substrate-binding protein n=1 Tax=Amphibacillus marinus TaxID=872970 RepID=A0A1H8KIA1_9BACI|nr:metal ABC transporter substrate-binding protein [Amphibacillus marinus]SEN92624.1 iron/zinc/copper transport system substrate-binding protein [Amphibacillus marinus]
MKKFILILGFILIFALIGCNSNNDDEADITLSIVTTYSIIYDITSNIVGEQAEVHSMVPIGSDPHEYDPLPEDIAKTTDADLVFYNGLNLEEGNSWFNRLLDVTGKLDDESSVFRVSDGVEAIYLETAGLEQDEDPHAWLDVTNAIIYAENIRDALIETDPDNSEIYQANADEYIEQLKALDQEIAEAIASIDQQSRHLVTSEGAFKYFGIAYNINTGYIWEINSETEGSPQQMRDAIDFIRENQVNALFVETSIDPRSMDTLASETGVPISAELYTDSLGESGSEGDTYIKMMRTNTTRIVEGLSQ